MAVSNDYNHQTVQLVVWCTTQYRVMRGIWCTTKYSVLRGVGCTTQLPLFYYHKQATSTATPNYCKRHISHTDTYSRDTGRHTRYTGPPLQVRAFITIILPTALLRVYINRSMYFIQGGEGTNITVYTTGKTTSYTWNDYLRKYIFLHVFIASKCHQVFVFRECNLQ